MKKSTIQVLSFLSGLTLAAVVVGVTIAKSATLRSEIENQLNSCLKTTRTLVDAYKSVTAKSKTAVNLIKKDTGESPETEEAVAEQVAKINDQWDALG